MVYCLKGSHNISSENGEFLLSRLYNTNDIFQNTRNETQRIMIILMRHLCKTKQRGVQNIFQSLIISTHMNVTCLLKYV